MLDQIGDSIWLAEGKCVNFHGFPYPTRSVIVRLVNGNIWVWSPVELTEALADSVETLGPVCHLVSPNKIHHLFLTDWCTRFPDAKVWGPNSTQKKRKELVFESALTSVPPRDWADEFEQFHVQGSFAMDEILFLHLKSKTLILADFSENFGDDFLRDNWKPWQRWLAKKVGIVVGMGFAPLDWRLSFLQKSKLRQVRDNLLQSDVHNVVMAHGEVQRSNGKQFLKQSLAWI